jgi:molybdate transport system regulatory protein
MWFHSGLSDFSARLRHAVRQTLADALVTNYGRLTSQRLTAARPCPSQFNRNQPGEHTMQTSARNQFVGEVTEVKHGAVNDEVTLRTQDGLEIVAIITHGSATSLGLAAGKKAFALVKASSVIVMVDVAAHQVSARNYIAGTVSAVTKGAVNAEVTIGAGAAQIAAIITNESVERLGLANGKPATAIFKASSVIIGVD